MPNLHLHRTFSRVYYSIGSTMKLNRLRKLLFGAKLSFPRIACAGFVIILIFLGFLYVNDNAKYVSYGKQETASPSRTDPKHFQGDLMAEKEMAEIDTKAGIISNAAESFSTENALIINSRNTQEEIIMIEKRKETDRDKEIVSSSNAAENMELTPSMSMNIKDSREDIEMLQETGKEVKHSKPKLILFFTPVFGHIPWPNLETTEKFLTHKNLDGSTIQCQQRNCEITYNKDDFERSDLVVFHGRDMPKSKTLHELHEKRPSTQRWVWLMQESPLNTFYNISEFNGMFNWTTTYRKDSEFFLPYFIHDYLSPSEANNYEVVNYATGKTKMAAWIVSNCRMKYRDILVKKFMKRMDVKIGGKCAPIYGQVNSPSCAWHCPEMFKEYRFYLAWENSDCIDYITEKYWHALMHGMIPIVIGGGNYTDNFTAIPNSYINALDFKSVDSLIDFMWDLTKNDTAYNEYFWWKKYYKVGFLRKIAFNCNWCQELNKEEMKYNVYNDLEKFWGEETCGYLKNRVDEFVNT